MRFSRIIASIASGLTLLFIRTRIAFAQNLGTDTLQQVGTKSGIAPKTPTDAGNQLPVIVGNIIRAFIGLLGVIFLVLMVYGGWLWLTARGESDRVEKAKQTISRAVIGLIIITSAYALTSFVITRLVASSSPTS